MIDLDDLVNSKDKDDTLVLSYYNINQDLNRDINSEFKFIIGEPNKKLEKNQIIS
jgi:hypothetical protein